MADQSPHKLPEAPPAIESHIIQVKELRRDLDDHVQQVKNLPAGSSREAALVITKLQEAIMWLGMELKRLHDTYGVGKNPYPNSKDPSNTIIDPVADGLKL